MSRDDVSVLVWSVVGHVALIAVLAFRLDSLPAPVQQATPLAIEARVVDTNPVRAREQAEREAAAQKEAEEARRRAAAEREAAAQRKAAAEREAAEQEAAAAARRKAEAERQAAEQQRASEARRKAEAERKAAEQRKAEEARRKAEAERKAAEQKKAEEARRKAEEARVAEQKRQEAEREAQFRREIEAEEARLAAISSGAQAEYIALIQSRVSRNWVRPPSATPGIRCDVHVSQIPGGTVTNVRVGQCNGDESVVRSIIAAVEKSSPLPPPDNPSLFERNLRFTFKPEE